jgi:hypothetical protein
MNPALIEYMQGCLLILDAIGLTDNAATLEDATFAGEYYANCWDGEPVNWEGI